MNSPYPQNRLSRSAEDYLEAIGTLCKIHGQALVSDVAQMLNVKKPSVTAAVHQLAEAGYVDYKPYAPIILTEKGKLHAESVIRAHQTLMRFLREKAGLCPERADEVACLMEHHLTDDEIDTIAKTLS